MGYLWKWEIVNLHPNLECRHTFIQVSLWGNYLNRESIYKNKESSCYKDGHCSIACNGMKPKQTKTKTK
jgi:hypothetical protein